MGKRVHTVRCMGGNLKFRALRLDHGNFGWASEGIARQTRIVDVVYNATSNELVRTKTHAFTEEEKAAIEKIDNCGPETKKKYALRQKTSDVAANLNTQFLQGKVLARISSRPGQCGRADGYILEGDELDFYLKKLKTKKSKA